MYVLIANFGGRRAGLYPVICFRGDPSMKLSGGTIEWPKATSVEARTAKRWRGLGKGCLPPQGWGSGVSTREIFENWDAIWCNLIHFGKKLTFLHFSTFVNENIAIVLNSGIDIVAYYFNLIVWMPSVSCCSIRLACSGCVKTGRGELMALLRPYGVAG